MNSEIPNRLRWACRRGMLELDVLLGNFLEKKYLNLTANEQEIFEDFLKTNDQTLFMWLTVKSAPDSQDFLRLVKQIRENNSAKNLS